MSKFKLILFFLFGLIGIGTYLLYKNKTFNYQIFVAGSQQTLAIIKPDAVVDKNIGNIINHIEKEKFNILGLKMVQLTKEKAAGFYAIHKEQPFFGELIKFITSGPIIVMTLEKKNAISEWRRLMGTTDPQKAPENTLRKLYGKSIESNAVHGSDSPENAKKEIEYFFLSIS